MTVARPLADTHGLLSSRTESSVTPQAGSLVQAAASAMARTTAEKELPCCHIN